MSNYVNLVGHYGYKDLLNWGDLDALAENDAYLKDNGWAEGTKTIFFQAAAPSGWTKSVALNDKIIRVVTGAGGGSGGSHALSTPIPMAHATHTIPSQAGHTHTIDHIHFLGGVTPSSGLRTSLTGNRVGTSASSPGVDMSVQPASGGSGSDSQHHWFRTSANPNSSPTLAANAAHDHAGATTGSRLTDLALAYLDVIICTKDASAWTYSDETETWASGADVLYERLEVLAANDKYNKNYLTPFGSVTMFGSAAAPTGWSRDTTHDNKVLRVVSGSGGGTGGTAGLSNGISVSHTHTIPTQADHTHTAPNHTHNLDKLTTPINQRTFSRAVGTDAAGGLIVLGGAAVAGTTVVIAQGDSQGSGTSGAGGSHSHGGATGGASVTDRHIAWFDVIQCSKNTAGSPSDYTDLTTFFDWKHLLAYQDLEELAANDEFVLFHTIPSGAIMFFHQAAAPATWTKVLTRPTFMGDISVDNRALRIVSGASADLPYHGQGGKVYPIIAEGVSDPIYLAHTHTIPTQADHSHALPSHGHTLQTTVGTYPATPGNPIYDQTVTGGDVLVEAGSTVGGSIPAHNRSLNTFAPTSGNAGSHNHGGTTGSALSDVTLAYADVICCQKD